MTPKKSIERLVRLIRKQVPGVVVSVDEPSRGPGAWFIDVKKGKQSLTVEFRPKLGFGLSSTPSEGFGEGPDEFLQDATPLVQRIARLFRTHTRTEPERVRLLRELREKRGNVSQVDVAGRLGIRQPTVSKLERREDVNLSTLRRYVEALGGELHVSARFEDGSVEIGLTESKAAAAR
jgi:DNA-binding transcriptional ArsR family regulator